MTSYMIMTLQQAMAAILHLIHRFSGFDHNLSDDSDGPKAGLVLVGRMSKPLLQALKLLKALVDMLVSGLDLFLQFLELVCVPFLWPTNSSFLSWVSTIGLCLLPCKQKLQLETEPKDHQVIEDSRLKWAIDPNNHVTSLNAQSNFVSVSRPFELKSVEICCRMLLLQLKVSSIDWDLVPCSNIFAKPIWPLDLYDTRVPKKVRMAKRNDKGADVQQWPVSNDQHKQTHRLTTEGLSFAMATTSFQYQFWYVSLSTPNVEAATSSVSYQLRKYKAQRRWTGCQPCRRTALSTSFFHRIAQVIGLVPKWAQEWWYSLSKLLSVWLRQFFFASSMKALGLIWNMVMFCEARCRQAHAW